MFIIAAIITALVCFALGAALGIAKGNEKHARRLFQPYAGPVTGKPNRD